MSFSYTFLIVGVYESLDFLSIFKHIKEDVNAKLYVGLFTFLGSVVSLVLGNHVIDNEFYKNLALSLGGNLSGYAMMLIYVVRMKHYLQKIYDERLLNENN